ncbi:PDP protein [Helicobacter saguini]|uniref:PDP protein n=1 Tax=Helicobacter saguini TaxID=1548018 RepID=A0A347VVK8_9HELI|nr:MotE family protein [Helicobacter saguini]MWV62382.1 PDP protein [Helicobacter saguini]MWV66946.1 PDP protein [Helicobacter saguini]MWV69294.1 PDP protein [Helicobacter saguini]MWV71150.1 PDP protein [Helicobacter saguini]TLD94959.1 PDP protein [Helicobacter saguini]
MKNVILFCGILCSIFSVIYAADSNAQPTKSVVGRAAFDPEAAQQLAKQCDAIFEARKQEIATGLLQLQQQQSTLQILSAENTKLLKEKEEQIKLKEQALKQMYSDMRGEQAQKQSESDAKLAQAKKILAQNEEILKEITNAKDSKLAEGYAKMKDSKAAPILAAMPEDDAVMILLSLKPNQMASILAQMQPDKAAELTKLIKYFPAKAPVPPGTPPPALNEGINVENNLPQNANETGFDTPTNPQNANPSNYGNPNGVRIY